MQGLLFTSVILLAFGIGAYSLQGGFTLFSSIHLSLGAAASLGAVFQGFRGRQRIREALRLRSVLRSLLVVVLVTSCAVVVERLATASDVRFDLSFERQYEVAPATRLALAALTGPVRLTVYHDIGDPRIRRTRILLDAITHGSQAEVATRLIDDSPEAEDAFGIGSSNAVIIEHADDYVRVERPTEGAIYEALASLSTRGEGVIYITGGTGEGEIDDGQEAGFSGFAVALQTEGYDVRRLPTAAMSEIPAGADAVVMIRPARTIRPDALAALGEYLRKGGNLIAFLEPGIHSGLEDLLAEFGLHSPDALIVDPLSDSVDGDIPGLSPIVFHYREHPITRGLQRNRSTVFRRARTFTLRKPKIEDRLDALAFTSRYSWLLEETLTPGTRNIPPQPASVATDYYPVAVAGRYPRDTFETRIVAFGDADFASNRYLRALYNLDLAMNAVNWALDREAKISLRPKSAGLIQFPVPVQNSLEALYGAGLLVPELLLLTGGLIYLRRRSG